MILVFTELNATFAAGGFGGLFRETYLGFYRFLVVAYPI